MSSLISRQSFRLLGFTINSKSKNLSTLVFRLLQYIQSRGLEMVNDSIHLVWSGKGGNPFLGISVNKLIRPDGDFEMKDLPFGLDYCYKQVAFPQKILRLEELIGEMESFQKELEDDNRELDDLRSVSWKLTKWNGELNYMLRAKRE